MTKTLNAIHPPRFMIQEILTEVKMGPHPHAAEILIPKSETLHPVE
jgi:hypothetical protein